MFLFESFLYLYVLNLKATIMTSIQERHRYILARLEREGFVRVQDLVDELGVTGATIRNDFRTLESQHLLYRNHGSASPVKQKVIDLPVQEKSRIRAAEKKRIALAAIDLLEEDDSVVMSSGSTIEAMAINLRPKGTLNVVTPSIRVGVYVSEKDNVEVMMLGGHIIKKSLSVRDTYSLEGLRNVNCSKLFVSCDGFDLDTGLTTTFEEEARITRSMMSAATKIILMADSSKYGKVAFGKICDFSEIDVFITDEGLPDNIQHRIEAEGVKVIKA